MTSIIILKKGLSIGVSGTEKILQYFYRSAAALSEDIKTIVGPKIHRAITAQ
jgi:hypothetical protein